MKRKLSVLLSLALCVGLLSGCGQQSAKQDSSKQEAKSKGEASQANDSIATDGELDAEQYYNMYLESDPTSLDISLRSDSYSSKIMINVMEGLIRTTDEDGEYVTSPGDAKTWECSDDGLVWTFHLGDNQWTDGEPVTSQQYVYSLQRSANPATGCPNGWFLSPIKNYDAISKGKKDVKELGVKAVDDKTLEITLDKVTPAFLKMIDANVYYPQRQDKVEEWGDKYGTEAQYTICNGPFYVDSWTHNNSLVLKKNANYWDADAVHLDKVHVAIMSDSTTSYSAYESGDLDYVTAIDKEWIDKFNSSDNNKYNQAMSNGVLFSAYNTKDELFQNVNIRKAFTLAIDREDANEMCYSGLRTPAAGWVIPAMSVGNKNYREKAGNMIQEMKDELVANGQTPKDLLLQGMKELGLGDDPSTLKVTVAFGGTSDWHRTFGEYLQQIYKQELGVNIELSFNEWGIFEDNLNNGNYQIGYMSWGAYYDDPYDLLSVFYSKYDQLHNGWKNEEFDKILDEAAGELDETKRLEDYSKAERILLKDDCVVCPIESDTTTEFYKSYVKGYSKLAFSNSGYKTIYTSGR